MSAIISKSILETTSELITKEPLSEDRVSELIIEFYMDNIHGDRNSMAELEQRIYILEHGTPDITISTHRVETIFEIVQLKGSIKTKQVKHILNLKRNIQAIRVMRKTARIHSANVYLFQSKNGNKEYSLNMKKRVQDDLKVKRYV